MDPHSGKPAPTFERGSAYTRQTQTLRLGATVDEAATAATPLTGLPRGITTGHLRGRRRTTSRWRRYEQSAGCRDWVDRRRLGCSPSNDGPETRSDKAVAASDRRARARF